MQTKTKTGLDLLNEHMLNKQSQAIATADEAVRVRPAAISDALRGQVNAYFRTLGLRDFSAVDLFFAWAGDRIYIDPEKSIAVGIGLCDDWKLEHPHLFFVAPAAEVPAEPRPRIFVDETSERHIQIGMVTVKFRPNQEIEDPYVIGLAQQHGIQLREGFERPAAQRPAGSGSSIVVAEERDRYISVGAVTVVFRAGETLTDPHKVQLARANGIAISER